MMHQSHGQHVAKGAGKDSTTHDGTAQPMTHLSRGLRLGSAAMVTLCLLAACRTDTAAVKQDREFNNRLGTMERIRAAYSDHVQRQTKASLLPPRMLAESPPSLPEKPEKPIVQTASFLPSSAGISSAMRQTRTSLVAFDTAPFPYEGTIARSDQPFMNVSEGGRRGHRTPFNRVYWEDETYDDPRVLLHIPRGFDIKRPAVMVLFFHGHGAMLERDVHLRQEVPRQISESGMNAVLVAPQLAVDAKDSSPGKFWEPGAVKRFLAEAATKLARLQGDPASRQTFANMPVVIVAYSGGFLPAAWTMSGGGFGKRLRGVVLLDALYGETDRFADWILSQHGGFFVSAFANSTRARNTAFEHQLEERSVPVKTELGERLGPGSVVFLDTGPDTEHRDFVTQAWTRYPVKDLLQRMTMADRRS
jgi:hypothetical protein